MGICAISVKSNALETHIDINNGFWFKTHLACESHSSSSSPSGKSTLCFVCKPSPRGPHPSPPSPPQPPPDTQAMSWLSVSGKGSELLKAIVHMQFAKACGNCKDGVLRVMVLVLVCCRACPKSGLVPSMLKGLSQERAIIPSNMITRIVSVFLKKL